MPFVAPEFSKNQVNKAGEILINPLGYSAEDQTWAEKVLANWRACHGYPINTFQMTLRDKLVSVDKDAIVAQRLKRAPSIILKLKRFKDMSLARMQDIGGLRAVLDSLPKVRSLEQLYRGAKFKHKLVSSKDYIAEPKEDGYRSVHLIYQYKNDQVPEYDGLRLELQIRTRLQHAWATAVETMGTFLGQALKVGQGTDEWRNFFKIASAALAIAEKTAPVPGFENSRASKVVAQLADSERKLGVLEKLQGFAIASKSISTHSGKGAYYLVVLNSRERAVSITPYAKTRLAQANLDYAEIEKQSKGGNRVEAVLVSVRSVTTLKKAYPNYFLDTQEFVRQIKKMMRKNRATTGFLFPELDVL